MKGAIAPKTCILTYGQVSLLLSPETAAEDYCGLRAGGRGRNLVRQGNNSIFPFVSAWLP